MSSILKALKKLEQEKVAPAHDSLEIDVEILRNSNNTIHNLRFSFLRGILPATLFFICGSAATYIYLNTLDQATIKQQVPYLAEIEKSIAAEVPAVSVPQVEAGVDIEKEPLYAVKLPLKKSLAKPENEKLKKTVLPDAPDKSATTNLDQGYPQKQLPSVVENVPLLQVNGIAFQPEGSDSVAIVNDNNVTGGSSINGATVEEILKDRVRFDYQGEKIEVLLGRSNQ